MRKLFALLVTVIVIAAGAFWFGTRIPSSNFDREAAFTVPLTVQQGEYAARLSDCVACHSVEGGRPFAGGLAMGTPIGTIYATNITPDHETGIGNYTLAQFDNAVRRGVKPDGARLYPAMPHPSYAKLSDDDIRTLYDYFMNHVDPVRAENRKSTIPWPLNARWPLAFWNLMFTQPGAYRSKTEQDDLWNRGAYLVQGPAHCGSCHTPRGLAFQELALDERDQRFLSGALLDGWYAPSLRNDHNSGLGRWSEADIVTFLKTGRNQHGVVFGSMTEAFNNSTQFMTDRDLSAIARYLKSLPGDLARDGAPWQHDGATVQAATASGTAGARVYLARCSFCHGADGKGRGDLIAPLAGVSSMLATESASAINITLNGSGRVVASGVPDAYRMPAFREQLTDREIADLLTFIRGAWGNSGGAVTANEVQGLRDHTNPARSDPIILQMR